MDREKLRRIVRRLLKKTTPDDLARLASDAGVTTPLAYHWRSGERLPPPDKLSAILRFTGADVATCEAAWAASGVDLSTVNREPTERGAA